MSKNQVDKKLLNEFINWFCLQSQYQHMVYHPAEEIIDTFERHRDGIKVNTPIPDTLFQKQQLVLHSGVVSEYKIECNALKKRDWECLAFMAQQLLPPFKKAVAVPNGGFPFARQLDQYADPKANLVLICDDVLTTGDSMESMKKVLQNSRHFEESQEFIGVVAFARGACADWVTPLFTLNTPEG